jgi:hypothetical protein
MAKRARWWIITQLNRLPGQCWADLVMWAMGWHKEGGAAKRTAWSPASSTCRRDAAATGTCYCGKLRRAGEPGA